MMSRDKLYLYIQNFVMSVSKKIKTISAKNNQLKPVIKVESYLAFDELNELLNKFQIHYEQQCKLVLTNYQGYERDAIRCCFEPLIHFLNERWSGIVGTDAIYLHSPESLINRVCFFLAQELTNDFETSVYDLLMYDLFKLIRTTDKEELITFKPHQFIIADDGVTIIDVAKCLHAAEKNKTAVLYHTQNEKKLLNENEKKRVINHSRGAFFYYDVIQYAAKHGINIANTWQKNEFFKEYISDTYVVTTSYGEDSDQKLGKYIATKFKNVNHFIQVILHSLSKNEWKDFIKTIPTKELKKIILDADNLISVLQQSSLYKRETIHNKAVLFCLSEIYLRELNERKIMNAEANQQGSKSTNSWYAWMSSYGKQLSAYGTQLIDISKEWLGGYSIEDKEAAVHVYQAFLLSDLELDQLNDYLILTNNQHLRGALMQGNLSIIVNQAHLVRQFECSFSNVGIQV